MKKVFVVVLVVLGLSLAACAGRNFETTHVSELKKGVQDKATVTEWFGKPYSIVSPLIDNKDGCVESWNYTYVTGGFYGAGAEQKSLTILFDKDGKVCGHQMSQTQ